jgi:hypothetical protein
MLKSSSRGRKTQVSAEQRAGINLHELATRLKNAVTTGATAPLVVAGDVARLAENWEDYRLEAGKVECTTWLQAICGGGRNLDWWLKRHEAVEKLGEASRRVVDHQVAVWITRLKAAPDLQRVMFVLRREQKKNHGIPLTKEMAVRALRAEELIERAKHETCGRCRILERVIRELGGEVPE